MWCVMYACMDALYACMHVCMYVCNAYMSCVYVLTCDVRIMITDQLFENSSSQNPCLIWPHLPFQPNPPSIWLERGLNGHRVQSPTDSLQLKSRVNPIYVCFRPPPHPQHNTKSRLCRRGIWGGITDDHLLRIDALQ